MNVLIYDSSVVPDVDYQQRITHLIGALAEVSVRFVTGIIEATWHIRDFRPDVIVFDWICDCKYLRDLAAVLRRLKPDLAMFHFDGESFTATAQALDRPSALRVPDWLHQAGPDWILARRESQLGWAAGAL